MRKVCRLAREVLDIAARAAKPGVTTDHIDKVVHDACVERNVSSAIYGSPCPWCSSHSKPQYTLEVRKLADT